jgi:cytochrome b involved in lipid metabolism
MPLENYSQNEYSNESENINPKNSKLTIILLILILIAGAYLGYAIYNSNQANSESISIDNSSSNNESELDTNTTMTSTPDNTVSTSESNQKTYTQAQVAEKNSKSDCWAIIDKKVYDITEYIPNHPGGEDEITKICGKDGTKLFAKPQEHKEGGASNVLSQFQVGILSQ